MKKSKMIAVRGFRMSPSERLKGRLMRNPDGHEGDAAAAAAAAAKAAAEAAAAKATADAAAAKLNTGANDDAAAELERLRAERDAALAEAKRFEGIDPATAKANAKKLADAEAAQRESEKRAAEAEGNFTKLREIQAAEIQAQIDALAAERDAARQEASAAQQAAVAARRSATFASSEFFAKETILTAPKAERIYGDYVEIEGGQVVVYDAPKDAAKRTKMMDAKGNPLPFDQAIKKVVEAEPDKDTFLKSKLNPGGNSRTQDGKPTDRSASSLSKIAKGLAARQGR